MYSELYRTLRERFDGTCANTENENNMRRREGQEKRRVEKEKWTHKQKTALGDMVATALLSTCSGLHPAPGSQEDSAVMLTCGSLTDSASSDASSSYLTWCPFLWPLSRADNGDSRLPPSMLVYRTCRRNRAVTTTGVRYTDLVLEVSEVVQIFSPLVAEDQRKKQMRQKWFRTLPDFQWW